MSLPSSGLRTVLIEGPENNLLNPEVMDKLKRDLLDADADVACEGILIAGKGDDFCGGLHLAGIRAGGDPVEYARKLVELLKVFPKLRKPIAAVVRGKAVASGASIVASCDYAVASPEARIGSYEVAVGVWPMVAQVPIIRRLGPKMAMENIGSGEPFDSQRAFEVGLVNKVVEDDLLVSSASSWLDLASRGKAANAGRVSFYEIAEMDLDSGLDYAIEKFAAQFRGN